MTPCRERSPMLSSLGCEGYGGRELLTQGTFLGESRPAVRCAAAADGWSLPHPIHVHSWLRMRFQVSQPRGAGAQAREAALTMRSAAARGPTPPPPACWP